MRSALAAAVNALLNDPRLVGALDVVRLAALVLLAKAPASSSRVRVTYRDLAGWLGCSVSHVSHTVIPALKTAGVVTSKPERDTAGHPVAVWHLIPLAEAREAGGTHPLALLNQRDLATLLRMCEAVTCPGWAPVDKPETPAGFMAVRRGPDAATDRLAMVLLVLHTRDNGRVCMAAGRVAKGFGRADATVARLLGCQVADAVAVVDRLVDLGKVTLGPTGRDRLGVPAVAEANAREKASSEAGDGGEGVEPPVKDVVVCPRCAQGSADQGLALDGDWWAQESFDDVLDGQTESAFGNQDLSSSTSPQVRMDFEDSEMGVRAAGLHTDHPPVDDLSGSSAGDDVGFSGFAVLGRGDQRGRAGTDEDQPEGSSTAPTAYGGEESPLRGDKRPSAPSQLSRLGRASFVGRVAVPEDLREVLAPLAWLWAGLGRESTGRWLAQAVRVELVRLRGVVGLEHAEPALACRLRRRLERQGARPVRDLVGWLLHRGLPQKAGCWSTVCDDGVRMDTGGPCESCECLVGDRRGLRQAVAAEVAARCPRLSREHRRPLYERELRARFEQRAAREVARREQAARDRAQLELAARARLAHEDAERAARPCWRCGAPDVAGICAECALANDTRTLVSEAVDIVLAMRADLDDREAVAALAEQVERDTWTVVRQVGVDVAAGEPVVRALAELERAQRLLRQRRDKVLAALSRSAPAEAEAEHVHRMALGRVSSVTDEAKARAEEAATAARTRVAHNLLASNLSDLYRCRATVLPEPRPWKQRLAELLGPPRADVGPALPTDASAPALVTTGASAGR
ncbi:hypothetical protein [Streptomyces sioyaensis]|uniref:hypothetical protein n=1 Tax=Streptomyces sioyaensis TaxID=67364 RepID=UPI0036E59070